MRIIIFFSAGEKKERKKERKRRKGKIGKDMKGKERRNGQKREKKEKKDQPSTYDKMITVKSGGWVWGVGFIILFSLFL